MNPLLFDRLGSLASATCALHCLAVAATPALIAVLGVEVLANEAMEWTLYGCAVAFGLSSAVFGYRAHGRTSVLGGFAIGLLLLSAARFGEALHLFEGTLVLSVLGGATLVGTHLWSSRCTRACTAESMRA